MLVIGGAGQDTLGEGDDVATIRPADGADTISGDGGVEVGDLTGSAIKSVAVDLGGLDQRVDTAAVSGTPGADKIKVAPSGTGHVVTGLTAAVSIVSVEPAVQQHLLFTSN